LNVFIAAQTRPGDHHVSPHRVWTFLHKDGDLSQHERDHILHCNECEGMLLLSLKSNSFAAFVKELARPIGK